ncbi:MAG: aspartate kinase [Peptostreptococcales bacterium]
MKVIVSKFGGTSLSDSFQMEKVRSIIESDKKRKYVIPSAPGKRFSQDNKITDLLYLCKTHLEHNLPIDQVFEVIRERYVSIVRNLNLKVDIDEYLTEVKENIKAGASIDYTASRGEYLNAIILAEYLGLDFIDAKDVIVFDKRGKLLEEETNNLLRETLAQHERAVIPGFYGSGPDGSIKTFSRGGSDITGALVAKAVSADVYENWTDVSGFLMADPRIVENPLPIKVISYKELRELSYMGASVMHEEAVFPVRQANIPINIRNTNEPDHEGTLITSDVPVDNENIITGIAGKKGFTVIGLYKSRMNSETGFIRRVLSVLEEYNISFEHIPTGIDTVSIVISNEQINGLLEDVTEQIKKRLQPDCVEIFTNMAIIATVGFGMTKRQGVAATLFDALYKAGVNIRMIDQGSSEMNIITGVENKDLEKAIVAIYNAFVKIQE